MATSTGGDGGGIDMRLSSSHLLRRRRRRRELLVVLAGEKRKEKQRSLGRERARTKERKNVSEEFRRDSRSPTFFFFSPRPPLSFPPASSSRRAASSSSSSRQPLPPPWAQPLVRVRVCDDSCPSARDGRCDDGRFLFPRETLSFRSSSGSPPSLEDSSSSSPTREVKCDLGTDCSDCGGEPWEAWLPQELARALPRPIAELRRGGGGGRSGGSDRGGAGERNDETVSSFSATSSPPPPPAASKPIFLCGHSLGGGLAALLAAIIAGKHPDLSARVAGVLTFAAPRFGDEEFAKHFSEVYRGRAFRYVHASDMVCKLPPGFGYGHHASERFITSFPTSRAR